MKNFRFGDFFLDGKEKVLLRDGSPVQITPKAFLLLQTLIENHGHIVEKEHLFNTVWPDSFVEDGNLSFTVNQVRKALGDNKNEPRFIETIPRRGYRFVAEVRHGAEGEGEIIAPLEEQPRTPAKTVSRFRTLRRLAFFSAGCAVIGAIFTGLWFASGRTSGQNSVLDTPFRSEKLSTDGKVVHVIISSDGKNVLYTNGYFGEKQSVWLRQLETGNNVEVLPASDDEYAGIALSPDGNTLFFARRPSSRKEPTAIYSVPVLGGSPRKIIEGPVEGWISVSPDGTKISFVRAHSNVEEWRSLRIADADDGKNERKLASRQSPIRIGDNDFSPDGKSVAFTAGQSNNAANEFGLYEVSIEDGIERDVSSQKFFDIKSVTWLADKSGLLVTASKIPNKHFLVWQVSSTTGEVQPLTSDSETYSSLSLDTTNQMLVSTQFKPDFQMRLFSVVNPTNSRYLADSTRLAYATNETILFTSLMSGNEEIWSINTDGSERRQLTNDLADDNSPVFSPDEGSLFFCSNRTGSAQVWRMNADGSNQIQITFQHGGFPLFSSRDGKWVYYHHGTKRTLWRVATMGGNEQLAINNVKAYFAPSPDGSKVAFAERINMGWAIATASLHDGQINEIIPLAKDSNAPGSIAWLPDGKSIAYVGNDRDFNYSLWILPLDGTMRRKLIDLGRDEVIHFDISPDGKSFAVAQGRWKHDAVLLRGLR